MTLEAAFALPFFLFAVINIVFAVNMIGTQSRINAALHQVGNKMAFAGYVYERTAGSVLPDSLAGVALTSLYARGQILEYTGRRRPDRSSDFLPGETLLDAYGISGLCHASALLR